MTRIPVKLKSTGQSGTVEDYEFNPQTYEYDAQAVQTPQVPDNPDPESAVRSQAPSVGGFAGNVLKSGGRAVGDILKAGVNVFNPNMEQNTIANLGKLAVGTGELLIPGEQGLENRPRAVGQFYKDRYGSLPAIGKTLYEDPVGAALDASVVLGGAGAVAKGVGTAGKVSELTRVGETLSAASRTVDPLLASSKLLGKGTNLITKGITKTLPERMMNTVFKETLKDTRAAIKKGGTLGEEALNRGDAVGTSDSIYAKSVKQINDTEDLLQGMLIDSKGKVDFSKVEADLKPYLDELKQSGNPAYKTLTDRIDLLKETNGTKIPDIQANEIKRSLYDEARNAYGKEAPPGTEGLKQIARSIKEQIGVNNIGVDQLNKDLSYYGRKADSMVDKIARERNNLVGVSDLPFVGAGMMPGMQLPAIAAYAGKKALGSTLGKTAIAQGLSGIGKMKLPPIVSKTMERIRTPIEATRQINGSVQDQTSENGVPDQQIDHANSVSQKTAPVDIVPQQKENGYPVENYRADLVRDPKNATYYKTLFDAYKDDTKEPVTLDTFSDKLKGYYFYSPDKSLSQGKETVGLSGILPRIGVEAKKLTDQKYVDNLKQYNDMRSIFAGMLNRARGAGTLNAGEYETVIANMPNEYTSETSAKAWFENVKELLKGIDISKSQVSITTE